MYVSLNKLLTLLKVRYGVITSSGVKLLLPAPEILTWNVVNISVVVLTGNTFSYVLLLRLYS